MTNNAIIERAKNQLFAEGKIGSSTVTTEHGEVEVPEEIHTYAMWKSLGYQVKKGEKAKILLYLQANKLPPTILGMLTEGT